MAHPTVPESGRGGWAMPLFPTLASLLCSQLLPLPALAGLFSALSLLPWGSSHVLRGLSGSGTEGLGYCRTCLEYSSPPEAAHASLHRRLCYCPWAQMPCPSGKGVSSPRTGSPTVLSGGRVIKSLLWGCKATAWASPGPRAGLHQQLPWGSQQVQGGGSTNLTSGFCCVTAAWCYPAASFRLCWV